MYPGGLSVVVWLGKEVGTWLVTERVLVSV